MPKVKKKVTLLIRSDTVMRKSQSLKDIKIDYTNGVTYAAAKPENCLDIPKLNRK